MPQSSQILTGKELPAFFYVKKNVYISASSVTIDLYIEGIVIKIQSTVKILPWKRKSLVMTMMASFLSNINIPAWSLFPPRAKSLFHFESSLWMLEMFPWYFFPLLVYLLVSRWCANLSHQAQTALFPQSKGQNNCHGRDGRVSVCACVCGGGIERPHSVVLVWRVKYKLPKETDIVNNMLTRTCLWHRFWRLEEIFSEICEFCMKTHHSYQSKSH